MYCLSSTIGNEVLGGSEGGKLGGILDRKVLIEGSLGPLFQSSLHTRRSRTSAPLIE